jgi:hypothetical protein
VGEVLRVGEEATHGAAAPGRVGAHEGEVLRVGDGLGVEKEVAHRDGGQRREAVEGTYVAPAQGAHPVGDAYAARGVPGPGGDGDERGREGDTDDRTAGRVHG